jgi:hypothetical protein
MSTFNVQMNVKVQNRIPKSNTPKLFQGKIQNGILVVPSQVLNVIQDQTISAPHVSFDVDLTFEL